MLGKIKACVLLKLPKAIALVSYLYSTLKVVSEGVIQKYPKNNNVTCY